MANQKTVLAQPSRKYILVISALAVLLAVYVFQRFNYFLFFRGITGFPSEFHPYTVFVVNRTIRLILNDTACLVLISAWFPERKYLRLAGYIFIFEVALVLPLYFWIKLSLEGDSEISTPWLSQIHRMIVNPMLMLLLMVAFVYQRRKEKEKLS